MLPKNFIFTPHRICYNFTFLALIEVNVLLSRFVMLGKYFLAHLFLSLLFCEKKKSGGGGGWGWINVTSLGQSED
jgi:hypothetical protein